jgi:hypothetical protein
MERTTGFGPATPTLARGYAPSWAIPHLPGGYVSAGQSITAGKGGMAQEAPGQTYCDPKCDP